MESRLHAPDFFAALLLLVLIGVAIWLSLSHWRRCRREQPIEDTSRPTAQAEPEQVTSWPYLLRIELLATLLIILLVSWWAILGRLPIDAPMDPEVTPPIAKAPWFFVGVQELLHYFDAWLAGVMLPLIIVVGLCALPYLTSTSSHEENTQQLSKWSSRRPTVIAGALLLFVWLFLIVVGLFFRGENWLWRPVWHWGQLVELQPVRMRSLAQLLHLSGRVGEIVEGLLVVGPFIALAAFWPRLKKLPWAKARGFARYYLSGALLIILSGVVFKIIALYLFGVRYFWVTPWFRI